MFQGERNKRNKERRELELLLENLGKRNITKGVFLEDHIRWITEIHNPLWFRLGSTGEGKRCDSREDSDLGPFP